MGFLPSRVIEKKREGHALSPREIRAFFGAYLAGDVPDYQMSAFLMAVHFRGMNREELEALLDLMIESGAVLDLRHLPCPPVDKHSTGGVGDKTSLVLAPLAAELGVCVPMISGRGLGHTTGTLDKLEAVPGFDTGIPVEDFLGVLQEVGVAMMGQTEEIAPLDRRLYALRDATATVPSIPLIAASIMSKKLAEGIRGLVLDVKTGAGAFLRDPDQGRLLARTMVELGEAREVRTVALLTGMDAPLGHAVGNALETREAFQCLHGAGPRDLADLSLALVGEMLWSVGAAVSPEDGAMRAREALDAGRGVERMARLVAAQGGDPGLVEDPQRISVAPCRGEVEARAGGFVHRVDPLALGYGVVELGGGRRRAQDEIDLGVGFVVRVKPGDLVEVGGPLGEVYAADAGGLERGRQILSEAVRTAEEEPEAALPLIRERITARQAVAAGG